jgi:hypothetical protein
MKNSNIDAAFGGGLDSLPNRGLLPPRMSVAARGARPQLIRNVR